MGEDARRGPTREERLLTIHTLRLSLLKAGKVTVVGIGCNGATL